MRTSRPLRTLVAPLALLTALALAGCGSSGTDADDEKAEPKPSATATETKTPTYKIKVSWAAPASQTEAYAKEILDLSETEGIADGFSENFAITEQLGISVDSGSEPPYYDPSTKTVHLSYGFADTTQRIIKAGTPGIADYELGKQWASVNDFILIHELGHAFVDVLEIPVTGREEDAVDGLATYFFTDFVEGGAEYAFAAANFFRLLQEIQGAPDATQYADEHSLSIQRYVDIACKVAGADEDNMEIISGMGIIPGDRLQRCPAEYAQNSKAWKVLLEPHLRGEDDADPSGAWGS